jgi:hypothetical protein
MPQIGNYRRAVGGAMTITLVLLCLAAYLHIAQRQSLKNRDMRWTDQLSYMNAAIKTYETRFAYTGDRNRMPLYLFLQALFYSPELSLEEFFQQGKRLNIVLSLFCVAALSYVFFSRFSRLYAAYAMLLIALIVFAIKSPFFQTELLFYTIFGLTYMFAISTIKAPNKYKTIVLGAMFVLCQYTKASAMPGLFIFAASYGVLVLAKLPKRQLQARYAGNVLFSALMPIFVFLLLLSPYLLESKEKYGTYFYNVNTTFYLWYDSWDEAYSGTYEAGDLYGWPDLPDEEIPTLKKYLDEHTLQDILARFADGIVAIVKSACVTDTPFRYAYGYCSQVALGLVALLASLIVISKVTRASISLEDRHTFIFAFLFFAVYVAAYAWYMPIINFRGTRTVLSLLIPLMWTIGLVVHHPYIRRWQVEIGNRNIYVLQLVYALISLTLLVEIYRMITYGASAHWAGA